MNKFLKIKFLCVPLATIFLAGCSDQKIEAVQGKYVDVSRVNTVSNLLNNRQECETIKWSSEKDGKQRDIIRYECIFKDSNDFLKPLRQMFIDNKIFYMDAHLEGIESNLSYLSDSYQKELSNEESNRISTKTALENFKNNNSFESKAKDKERFYTNLVNKLKEIQNDKNPFEFIKFLNDVDFNKLFNRSNYHFTADATREISSVQSQSYYMYRYPEDQRKDYYERNMASDLSYVFSKIPILIKDIEGFYAEDMKEIQAELDSELAKLENNIKYAENANRSKYTQERISEIMNELDVARKNYDNDFHAYENEILELLPIYKKGSEQYWWTVNDNLEVNYVGGGVFGYIDNNPFMYYQFFANNENYLAKIHSESYQDMKDYLHKTHFQVNNLRYPKQ